MGFRCPVCSQPGALEIQARIQLPADARSDEIALQLVRCAACGFAGPAVYEESRRGALDSEAWDHYGWRVPAADLADFEQALRACPAPEDEDCSCAAHHRYAGRDAAGRWLGAALFHVLEDYDLRR